MLYLPIGVITLRFCKVLDSTFLFMHSTLFCLDSAIWLDSSLKLYYGANNKFWSSCPRPPPQLYVLAVVVRKLISVVDSPCVFIARKHIKPCKLAIVYTVGMSFLPSVRHTPVLSQNDASREGSRSFIQKFERIARSKDIYERCAKTGVLLAGSKNLVLWFRH